MEVIINLLLISVICVIITDITDFKDFILDIIYYWLYNKKRPPSSNFNIKPITCSLCQTHWTGLIYLLFTGFTLQSYALLLFISVLTPTIASAILLIREILDFIIAWVSQKL